MTWSDGKPTEGEDDVNPSRKKSGVKSEKKKKKKAGGLRVII